MTAEDLLTSSEKLALHPETITRKRAKAVLSAAQATEALKLSEEAKQEFVDRIRTLVEQGDPQRAKQVKKAMNRLIDLADEVGLVDTTVPSFSEDLPDPDPDPDSDSDSEIPLEVAVISDEVVSETEVFREVDTQPEENPSVYIKSILRGEGYELDEQTARLVAVMVMSKVSVQPRPNAVDYVEMLTLGARGLSYNEIARTTQRTQAAVYQSFLGVFRKVAQLSPANRASLRNEIQKIVTAQDDTVDVVSNEEASEVSKPEETQELTHTSLGEAWADRLALDRRQSDQLKDFLNPSETGRQINQYTTEAVDKFIEYVDKQHGGLDSPTVGLTDRQKAFIRMLTGGWYENGVRREPTRLGGLVERMRRNVSSGVVISDIYDALNDLLVDNEIELTSVTTMSEKKYEDWRQAQYNTLRRLLSDQGMRSNQIELLWERIHIGINDEHLRETPELKPVLAVVQAKLARTSTSYLTTNRSALTALRMLTNTALGSHTINSIYEKLTKENPDVQIEDVERMIISGVVDIYREG